MSDEKRAAGATPVTARQRKPSDPDWPQVADQAWQALHELLRLLREQGRSFRSAGIGWDFERGIHALRVFADSPQGLPTEVVGLRVFFGNARRPLDASDETTVETI